MIILLCSVGASVEGLGGGASCGSRGSRLARQRARKMKELYGINSPARPSSGEEGRGEGEGEGDSDLEREATELYQWTQTLSIEDVR